MLSNDASRRHVAETLAIPLGLGAPATARSFVARHVAGVAPTLLDTALLLVSELVTNSVRHSGAGTGEDVTVHVRAHEGECRVEVEDPGNDGEIGPQAGSPLDGTGVGLQLVETLSDQWGVARGPEGPTRVWARLVDPTVDAPPAVATAVVERVSVYASPDPNAATELAEARGRASRGDSSWTEWLDDVAAGRAVVAHLRLEITLSVAGARRRATASTPGVWLELEPHPPLVERQVQDAAAIGLATLGSALAMPLGAELPTDQLAMMNVHVELDDAIRQLLPAPG
jgi:serine/threonine-protein kinase RsbW